ncbi:MAG: hypothetical protein NTY38_03110, partial [Acidobacteria bacterium]|nr:hypothetical protein [Acidobacteriota bacterium]
DGNARALRPMLGFPGAAYLARALATDCEIASVSPDGSTALVSGKDGLLVIRGLRSSAPETLAIEGILPGADRFAWSSSGDLAVLLNSRARTFQIARNLRQAPSAGDPTGLTAAGDITAIAVDSAGRLLIAIAGEETGGIYLQAAESSRLIWKAARPTAFAFTNQDQDLYTADAATSQIWLVQDYAGAASAALFSEDAGALVGLAVSSDARRLFAASAEAKAVTVFDAASRAAVARVNLDCAPTELRRFGDHDLWLLNSGIAGEDPLYVFSGIGEPGAWFVPAGREQ